MKLNKWLYGAMALGMFAACSNDMPDNGPVISRDGDYMAVSINLPTVASTRAVNDNYDDGKPDEYKVNNGCLVIFKGEPDGEEKDAKFAAAYRLNGLDASETPDDKDETPVDNITTSYKKSVKLENLEYNENDKLYAFVMLNYIGIATVDESNSQLTVKGKDGDISADGNTFAQIFLTETKEDFHSHGAGNIETNFFMCNSPLSTAPGDLNQPNITEGFAIKTLVEINKDKIFSKREDAEKDGNSACSVNVERGLAKATINWQPTGFSDDSNVAANGKKPSFSVIGWTLDVKEPTTYIARNVEGAKWWDYNNSKANTYRFVGDAKIGTTPIQPVQNLYRTYWCYDPHYNQNIFKTGTASDGNNSADTGTGKIDWNKDNTFTDKSLPLYCYENTFDVTHQNYRNTTRAVFRATLQFEGAEKNSTFYVINDDESNIYLTKEDAESFPKTRIMEMGRLRRILEKCLAENKSYTTEDVNKIINIEFERDNNTGIRKVVDVTFNELNSENNPNGIWAKQPAFTYKTETVGEEIIQVSDDKKYIIENANAEYVITEFVNGNCYYDLRFMHFASDKSNPLFDLAPWEEKNATTTDMAYGNNENDYLGRYGMVRNNWYDVTITSVRNLGSPVVPDVEGSRGDTSDDNKEIYLAFKVNVLSWAKRTQNVEF